MVQVGGSSAGCAAKGDDEQVTTQKRPWGTREGWVGECREDSLYPAPTVIDDPETELRNFDFKSSS